MKLSHQLTVILMALSSFSCKTIDGEIETTASVVEGVPGGEVTETTTITATVTGIDTANRRITFVTPQGNKFTTKAGPSVKSFDRIQIGDQLKATLTEEVVIRMAKPGEKLDETSSVTAGVPPKGSKPGVTTTESAQVTATVSSIDLKKRKVKLQFSDGSSKKIKVRPDIDLSQRSVGEKVVIRITETTAINLEKP